MHVKLDELIRATDEARNRIIGSEKLSETVLHQLEHEEEQEAGKDPPAAFALRSDG